MLAKNGEGDHERKYDQPLDSAILSFDEAGEAKAVRQLYQGRDAHLNIPLSAGAKFSFNKP